MKQYLWFQCEKEILIQAIYLSDFTYVPQLAGQR